MISRILAMVLMLGVCLVCAPAVLAQKPGPDVQTYPPKGKPTDTPEAQKKRFDAELDKLTKSGDATRQKDKPAAEAKLQMQVFEFRETDAREMAQVLHELYRDDV